MQSWQRRTRTTTGLPPAVTGIAPPTTEVRCFLYLFRQPGCSLPAMLKSRAAEIKSSGLMLALQLYSNRSAAIGEPHWFAGDHIGATLMHKLAAFAATGPDALSAPLLPALVGCMRSQSCSAPHDASLVFCRQSHFEQRVILRQCHSRKFSSSAACSAI